MTNSRETCSYTSFQLTWYRIDFHNNNFQIQLFFSLPLLLNNPVIKDEIYFPFILVSPGALQSSDQRAFPTTLEHSEHSECGMVLVFFFNSSKNKQANFLILHTQSLASSCVAWLHGFGMWCPLTIAAFLFPTQTLQPVSNHLTFHHSGPLNITIFTHWKCFLCFSVRDLCLCSEILF